MTDTRPDSARPDAPVPTRTPPEFVRSGGGDEGTERADTIRALDVGEWIPSTYASPHSARTSLRAIGARTGATFTVRTAVDGTTWIGRTS